MEEVAAKGLSKAIGLSNVSITKTEKLLETAKIVPAVNQVECQPYLQQQKLKEYCDSKGTVISVLFCTQQIIAAGIILEAYSPLGNPGSIYRKEGAPNILEDPVIKEVAEKHNATVAQVTLSTLSLCVNNASAGLRILCPPSWLGGDP